jgi:hypothetical protein
MLTGSNLIRAALRRLMNLPRLPRSSRKPPETPATRARYSSVCATFSVRSAMRQEMAVQRRKAFSVIPGKPDSEAD